MEPNVRHSRQQVLTVPASALSDIYSSRRFITDASQIHAVLEIIRLRGEYLDRDMAEKHDTHKQIIACAVVRHGARFLCLRRSKNTNRASLRLRYTLLFGGHVDDSENGSGDPLWECVRRECGEEIGLTPSESAGIVGLAVDPLTPSGWLHIGIVYEVLAEQDIIPRNDDLDQSEFAQVKTSKEFRLADWSELRRYDGRFDPWSELLLESDYGQTVTGARERSKQLYLSFG